MDVTITRDSDGIPAPLLTVGPAGVQALLAAHSGLMYDLSAAHRWFDNPDVPPAEKEARWLVLFNMQDRQKFLYQLLRTCGVPQEEIMKDLALPF